MFQEKYVDCQDINYSEDEDTRRDTHVVAMEKVPTNLGLHSALHNETFANGSRRYQSNQIDGGFCEVKEILINYPLNWNASPYGWHQPKKVIKV